MRLREVLAVFEQSGALSLTQLCQHCGVDRSVMEGMILFWVRKGRLREVGGEGCTACSAHKGCPMVINLPRRYELVTESDSEPKTGVCACSG